MIESRLTAQFRKLFRELPRDVQEEARRAYRLFQADPTHPGLRFKKLRGSENIHSVRIGLGYRAIGVLAGKRIVWYWIGDHSEYDRLV